MYPDIADQVKKKLIQQKNIKFKKGERKLDKMQKKWFDDLKMKKQKRLSCVTGEDQLIQLQDIKLSRQQQEVRYIHETGMIFFNWDSHHAWLNSQSKQWSYKKMKHKKIKTYRKSLQKQPTVKALTSLLMITGFRMKACSTKRIIFAKACS